MNSQAAARADFGVCAYSFPCSCGFARRDDQARIGEPLDGQQLIALATTWGLRSIEMPLSLLADVAPNTLDQLRARLEEHDLTLVVDTAVVDPATLRATLPLAARAGARVVRAMLSTILEGARADVTGGRNAYLDEMQQRLSAIRPMLEAHNLVLALENHQDATSDDLVMLCEAGGGQIGVTLDVANPLAVAEEPLEFARKVGPWIRNVHLKDYHIFPTPSGYRLVRCALGQGVMPFPALLPLLREVAPSAPRQIELAALYARHIRLYEDTWWDGYPARDVRDVVPLLRFVAQHARPAPATDLQWQTPWERGESREITAAYEQDQFIASVQYLRSLDDQALDSGT